MYYFISIIYTKPLDSLTSRRDAKGRVWGGGGGILIIHKNHATCLPHSACSEAVTSPGGGPVPPRVYILGVVP